MTVGLVAALAAAALFGVAAVVQARAARDLDGDAGGSIGPQLIRGVVTQPLFLLAVLMNLGGFGLHFLALRALPLFLAQAAISTSLVVTALLAVRTLGERLRSSDWVAIGGVVVGLVMLSLSAGDHATVTPAASTGWYLLVLAAAVVVAALVIDRTGPHPFALGLLAGTLFGTVSIAGRLVPGSVADLATSPATYALALAGASAFLVYSVALRRGHVARVTAPLVAMQTVLPAAVGLAFLGDSIRSGWVAVACIGLVVTLAGSAALARFEATGHESVAH
ncbi:MAG: EamA family transporter [Nocardioidaceae bacterium]|nr:EamA family transporter [Nocardioidaceae bacterium]